MQHEIATAEGEVARLEDTILELMIEGDDLDAAVEAAARAEREEGEAVERERAELEERRAAMEGRLAGTADERARLAEGIGAASLRLFESIAGQRQGLAVVEARNGHCTVCNVRLRPQVFNQVLLNTELIRCESCRACSTTTRTAPRPAGGGTVRRRRGAVSGAAPRLLRALPQEDGHIDLGCRRRVAVPAGGRQGQGDDRRAPQRRLPGRLAAARIVLPVRVLLEVDGRLGGRPVVLRGGRVGPADPGRDHRQLDLVLPCRGR